MIFPVLETEDVVQVNDQTRLSAVKSFISKDEQSISLVEIQPESGGSWIDVTGGNSSEWYLDWIYTGSSRTVTVSVRITTNASPTVLTKTVSVKSVADDKLFSADQDLLAFEPDILKWVPDGRASFLNIHRAAKTKILEALDESGIVDSNGNKLTDAAVVDVTEVRAWSRDMTLSLIFKGLINQVDDVFTIKSKYYASEAEKRKNRAVLRLDLNGDGEISKDEGQAEGVSFQTMTLIRT
jgi:hypothetical protein